MMIAEVSRSWYVAVGSDVLVCTSVCVSYT
jgi:hypothetical protein